MLRNRIGPGGERLLVWLVVAALVVAVLAVGVVPPVDLGAFGLPGT